ncbi:MAG: acetylxylan esterase [Isosphaeraceae bacterium]
MRSHALFVRLAALALALAFAAPALALADFPDVEKLPPRQEMPDPLVLRDGSKVADKDAWFSRGRPELKALFEHYMYGKAPDAPSRVEAEVVREDGTYLGGKATLREVTLTYGPAGTPPVHLLLITPKGKDTPSPVFLGLNFHGNHVASDDPKVALPTAWMPDRGPGVVGNRATEKGRGQQIDAWPADLVIGRGYALATVYSGDFAPDHPGHADGVHPSYPGHDWGTVRAWAWGLSRVADHLVTVPEIDRTKLAVVGHSRLGKAAMVAGAFDDRFGVVIPLQAGCGGTAPNRGKIGESVKQINDRFPHWFNANYKTFNERPERLPFDQNGLVALCAPRAVLFSNAVEDTWANPEGQFAVLKAAEPVYRLLNAGGLESPDMPETGKLSAGTLGYAIRPGKHSMTREDWGFFLDFADKHFGR